MLPKAHRLTRREFTRYFTDGKRIGDQYFTVIYSPGPSAQAAVSVGKKVSKQAVLRNRLRRRVYAIIKDWFGNLINAQGVVIVIVKPAARTLSKAQFTEVLQTLLGRVPKKQ